MAPSERYRRGDISFCPEPPRERRGRGGRRPGGGKPSTEKEEETGMGREGGRGEKRGGGGPACRCPARGWEEENLPPSL